MSPEPYVVELDPDTKTTLKIYLIDNVRNAEIIRYNIIHGVWKCAAIKPDLIIEPFQVAVAANKAVLSEKYNTMVTRTVYSEILYNLSITKNISQSLSRFGIEKDTSLLLCFLVFEDLDTSTEVLSQIEGEFLPISDLKRFTSMKNLNIKYKLNALEKNQELADIIVSRMVTKSFVTH